MRRFLAGVLTVVLAACSGGGQSPSAATSPSATAGSSPSAAASVSAAPTTPNLAGTTLTLWLSEGVSQGVQKQWSNFEQATGAKIDYLAIPNPFEDSLLAKWTAGDRPDILGWHPTRDQLVKVQPEKNLVDLSNEAFVAKTKFDLYKSQGSLNGKVYEAITTYPDVSGMFYNKAVFQRLNLTAPKNWDELIQLCGTIKAADPKVTPIAAGGGAQWPPIFILSGYYGDEVKAGIEDEINAGTVKFSDPRLVAGLDALMKMKQAGCFEKDLLTSTYEDQVARLYEGKAAMVLQGSFLVDDMSDSYSADLVNQKIGFFPVSAKGQLVSWSSKPVGTYAVPINKDPAKQAAALEFIRYTTGPGFQQYLDGSGDLPVLNGYEPPSSVLPLRVETNKFLEAGGVPTFGLGLKAPHGNSLQLVNEMFSGVKTPQQVGDAMQKAFEEAVKALTP
jgi:raffinose/stachyose/melibiose transport system substrate-binding protein